MPFGFGVLHTATVSSMASKNHIRMDCKGYVESYKNMTKIRSITDDSKRITLK